jgi:hypothetical protein
MPARVVEDLKGIIQRGDAICLRRNTAINTVRFISTNTGDSAS